MASDPTVQPPGAITTVTAGFLAQLNAQDKLALSRLAIGYRATMQDLAGQIDGLAAEIAQLEADGQAVSIGKVYRLRRAQALLAQADAAFAALAKVTGQYLPEHLHQAALAGAQAAQELTAAALGPGPSGGFNASWATLPEEQVRQLAGQLSAGSPLRQLLDGFGPESSAHFQAELGRAVAQGWSAAETAKRLKAATGMPLGRAGLIARTEILRAAREAQRLSYRQNSHLVKEWVWVAGTHGSGRHRTCAACWAMHGSRHPLDEPMSGHPGCRCTQAPLTKTWEELGFPKGTGPEPPAYPAGEDLFKEFDPTEQERILGAGRFKLYQEGVKLRHMVDVRHSPAWGTTRSVKSIKAIKEAQAQAAATKLTPEQRQAAAAAKALAEKKAKKAAYNKQWKAQNKAKKLAQAQALVPPPLPVAKEPPPTKAQATKKAAPKPKPTPQPAKAIGYVARFEEKLRAKAQTWFKRGEAVSSPSARAQAKARIQQELGRRLANDPAARQAWARWNAGQASWARQPMPTTEAEWSRTLGEEANRVIKQWAITSGDHNPLSVAAQLAVREEFGLDKSLLWWDPKVIAAARTEHADFIPFLRRMSRHQYEWTQEELRAAGIEEVSLVRGMHLKLGTFPGQAGLAPGAPPITAPNPLQPASSFTTNVRTAKSFAGTYDGYLFRVTVPRELVLSMARTGYGCLNEYEWVLLAGDGEALVEKP